MFKATAVVAMLITAHLFGTLPDILRALKGNPEGVMVLVCLAAFALIAFVIQKLK
jgi:hypothetical protein